LFRGDVYIIYHLYFYARFSSILVLELASNPIMLRWRDAFRTYDWGSAFSEVGGTAEDVNRLLNLVK